MLSADVLLSEFTARKELLVRLLDIIRANDPNEPPQHILIVGPRGMGKTTLLWAIVATIERRDDDLRAEWQPVPFDEESRRIGDLADFWLECIRQWETATEAQVQTSRVEQLLKAPGDSLEENAKTVFLDLVIESKKRAILLIDNLNVVLASIHDNEALLRLRSFLMSESRIMIIGAATQWFGEVTNIDKPFYEFFRPFDLKPLKLDEMKDCLAGIAESRGDSTVLESIEKKPGSVEALHLLTGRKSASYTRLLSITKRGP